MIFVTVGSMLPFDRLIKTVDDWAQDTKYEDVIFQIGNGKYLPGTGRWERKLPPQDFTRYLTQATIVVGHLGMGTVISGMTTGRPLILMPRDKALGEHTTDHQLHAVEWLRDKPGLTIYMKPEELKAGLSEVAAMNKIAKFQNISTTASPELIGNIANFINKK